MSSCFLLIAGYRLPIPDDYPPSTDRGLLPELERHQELLRKGRAGDPVLVVVHGSEDDPDYSNNPLYLAWDVFESDYEDALLSPEKVEAIQRVTTISRTAAPKVPSELGELLRRLSIEADELEWGLHLAHEDMDERSTFFSVSHAPYERLDEESEADSGEDSDES